MYQKMILIYIILLIIKRSTRTWKPNLRKVKAIIDGEPKRINVCTKCLRSGKVERA